MNRKPNRWNAARDAHDAAMRCPPHRTPYRRPAYSLPVTRVLRWMVGAVVIAAAYSFAAPYVRAFLGV